MRLSLPRLFHGLSIGIGLGSLHIALQAGARKQDAGGLYKTVILDEINPTVDLELIPVEPIVQTLLRKPAETEVILTGRCKHPPAYFDLASVHSEMVCHKHYAEQGVDLKRGVDY